MVRQKLIALPRFIAAFVIVLVTGCAATQPPPQGPATGPERLPPAETPQPDAEPPVEESVPSRPTQDARAPTVALLRQSQRSADDGDLEGAIAYVERAIRLDSRDAALWLRLAQLQLAAERPAAAEQLAHKAIALAGREDRERRQAWLLLADALEAQGDDEGAARIRARWRTYRG